MPCIPYPPFRCGTILYNINKYNLLFYSYHSLWSWARHLYGVGPKPGNLSFCLNTDWAISCMCLIYSSSLIPPLLLCLYPLNLGSSFVGDGPNPAKFPSFVWAEPRHLWIYISFLFPPPPIAFQIFALMEEGDLTETVVSWFELSPKSLPQFIVSFRSIVLKRGQRCIVRSKLHEPKCPFYPR